MKISRLFFLFFTICVINFTLIKMCKAQVFCNRFIVSYEVNKDNLKFSLDTDLPDNTILMVSVSRSYFEKGKSDEYVLNYFDEKSTVKKWRKSQTISISSGKWKNNLIMKQKKLSKFGLGFEVKTISDKINIDFVVPFNQKDSRFGKFNSKLMGDAVTIDEVRVVEKRIKFHYPLSIPINKNLQKANIDPFNLQIGETYKLSKLTPLMHKLKPDNPLKSIKNIKYIKAEGIIQVMKLGYNKSKWYKVITKTNDNGFIGVGWINSVALIGQNIMKVGK